LSAELPIRDLAPREREGAVLRGPLVADFPDVMEAIHSAALARPTGIAVESGHDLWTYRQLVERAGTVAALLASRGIGANALVAICMPRSGDMLAAILGVLEVGAAYLPLDCSHPPARLAQVLAGAAPSLVLAEGDNSELLASLTDCPVITLGDALR